MKNLLAVLFRYLQFAVGKHPRPEAEKITG